MQKLVLALMALGITMNTALAQNTTPIPESTKKLSLQFKEGGASATTALNQVLKNSEATPGVLLFTASAAAWKARRLEDSAYLFYVAQMRARYDVDVFPPKGQGGDDPRVLFGGLNSSIGQVVNPAVMAQPAVFKRALARVGRWEPRIPTNYHPGWDYTTKVTTAAPRTAQNARKRDTMKHMGDLATLLSDPEYFKNFRVVQNYNLSQKAPRPTKAAFESAKARLIAIEKSKNIAGPMTASTR